MSETQAYKFGQEFTLPAIGAPYLRALVKQRLETVRAVLEDPNASKCFKESELVSLAFEGLQLGKMLERMPRHDVKVEVLNA
jgi:hypothetical protein